MAKLECENKDELKAQCNHFRCCAHILNLIVKASLKLDDVVDNDPIDSNLHQLKVNMVDLGEDYDESDYYKQYLSESSTKSERSQLDIYLEEPELKLNSQIDVLDYWSKSSIQYRKFSFLARDLLSIPILTVASESAFSMENKVITSLRSSLKLKIVQAIVCFND
ncbi:hypothetical protein J1N35_011865 [Gossypium stocksii]|uniref:HAT C-terminal dimerisation domain-containing protein n=1 Tax=Gossypium stocksii TaxID=47602 RepID=A0A9D3W3I8_9ROSI|nr:hypothetical protein J1N35_011865 [Gossypium stocksii]